MARHETTGARLAAGGRLPVLVLRRSGDDAELACEHLQHSQRLDVTVVRPADLVRTPLRWPSDARVVPLALCVVFHDRPTTAASARQLVDHVGEVPVIAVLDAPAEAERTAELAAELVEAGVGAGWWWAAGLVIIASLAGVFYGGRLIERMYFRRANSTYAGEGGVWRVTLGPVLIAAIATIAWGLAPGGLLRAAASASLMLGGISP